MWQRHVVTTRNFDFLEYIVRNFEVTKLEEFFQLCISDHLRFVATNKLPVPLWKMGTGVLHLSMVWCHNFIKEIKAIRTEYVLSSITLPDEINPPFSNPPCNVKSEFELDTRNERRGGGALC